MSAEPIAQDHPIFEISGPVATVIFNRPDKANAMMQVQNEQMRDFLFDLEEKPEVRCVLIKANGKHFMAGGDLGPVTEFGELAPAQRAQGCEVPLIRYAHMIRVMQRLQKPIVASVQGMCAGIAVGLVAACDLVIAADTAQFWAAHIIHGSSSDGLLSYFLPRQIGVRKALEMAMLAERISAVDAKDLGLINFVVPEAKLAEETEMLVGRLAKGPTVGYGLLKQLMYSSLENSLETQGALEAELLNRYALRSADVKEGISAFFERRTPKYQGR